MKNKNQLQHDEKNYILLKKFSKLPIDKKDLILKEAILMFQENVNSSQSKRQSDLL